MEGLNRDGRASQRRHRGEQNRCVHDTRHCKEWRAPGTPMKRWQGPSGAQRLRSGQAFPVAISAWYSCSARTVKPSL
jgi:hypothetical protein